MDASTTSTIDRDLTGPFVLAGLDWGLHGNFGATSDPDVARAACAQLLELGFTEHRRAENDWIYQVVFTHPGYQDEANTGHWICISIIFIPRRFSDRPEYEVAYTKDGGQTWQRFEKRTYPGPDEVDASHRARARDRFGRDGVAVRFTF